MKRRTFFKSTAVLGSLGSMSSLRCDGRADRNHAREPLDEIYWRLDQELDKPVLKRQFFDSPVVIDCIELLRYQDNFICRAISDDGTAGSSVSNNSHMVYLYPIVVKRIIPFFIRKDARDLDLLIDQLYVHDSNYKLQGLAFWISLATVEFALLDLLGRIAGVPMGELIGEIYNREIAVYQANNYRGRSAEESIELIRANVESTGARAVKFKIGGRMSRDADDPPGRTEKLIPLVRKTFGDEMTIYADSNGSYSVAKAIEIGRLLQQYNIDFYEEPVPFDWYEEIRQVSDALTIAIAGGEQESSLHNFRWLIANGALQIVQPDMFYFGGMIRSMKVARMAHCLGLECTPHISGSGLGYLYMMHFVSAIANAGLFHEFKGFNRDIPFECDTSALESEGGVIKVPAGAGTGLVLDPDFVNRHRAVSA